MTDTAERINRAHNAKRALEEFLDPAFGVVAEEYENRLTAICATRPWAANEIAALANALRVVREVRGQIEAIVMDGEFAKEDKKRAERVGQLSPAKRRLFNIGAI